MKIIPVQQGTDEWLRVRMGIPSASCFDKIITPAKGELSKSAIKYVAELLSHEHVVPTQENSFRSPDMIRGIQLEPEARKYYAMENDTDVRQVGFVTTDDGRFGCSPDALVYETLQSTAPVGGLELKCPAANTHLFYLLNGGLPDEYKVQVHGNLAVTGLPWCDFMSYYPPWRPHLVRVFPDKFTHQLLVALEGFHEQLTKARVKFSIAAENEVGQ